MKVVIQPMICSSIKRIAHIQGRGAEPLKGFLSPLPPSKLLHLTVETRRRREVTLPKVKLLVRGRPGIQTPRCLTAGTKQSVCALRSLFLGLENLPAPSTVAREKWGEGRGKPPGW